MKKRGFTLVELLGVIIILAIITLLAVSGFGIISKNVKEQAHENLISYIETKASEYANNTGNLLTNVDNLVKLGYIEADDEEGNVKSPIDDAILNCHIVSILKDNNSLYGEYSEEEECDLGNLTITNMNLGILKYKTEDTVFNLHPALVDKIELEEDWTNKNVYLVATLGEKLKGQESQIKKITWTSNVGSEEREVNNNFELQNKYLVTAEQIINTDYTVQIELENKTIYQASTSVKIDKQRPVIYEVFVERPNEWTNKKKVTITASDGNGSGMAGYAFTKDNNDCKVANYIESNENSFETTINEVGTYYVCAKDKAGNYSEDYSSKVVEVKMIDAVPPTCVWRGESTSWTKSNRTISLNCNDTGGSGCSLNNAIAKTYSWNTRTDYLRYTISDVAGNTTVCEKTASVYVDKCTQVGEKEYGPWGSCSKSCGGGHKSRSWSVSSTFGSGFICGTGSESKSCNTKSCSSSGSSGGSSDSGSGGKGCNSCNSSGSSGCCGPGVSGCSSTCTTSDHTCSGNGPECG